MSCVNVFNFRAPTILFKFQTIYYIYTIQNVRTGRIRKCTRKLYCMYIIPTIPPSTVHAKICCFFL